MRVLLDFSEAPRRSRPHTFLWYVGGDDALSKTCYELVENTGNAVFVSIAGLWEVAIKASLGKLELQGAHTVQELAEVGVYANRLELLEITPHTSRRLEDSAATPPRPVRPPPYRPSSKRKSDLAQP